MAETGKSKTCVWRSLERFMHEGVNGLLRDRSRPPGKAPIPPERVAEIVRLTQQAPPHEATPKTLHLESRPRSNHRRTKQRVPNVGINPLAFTNTLESRRKAGTLAAVGVPLPFELNPDLFPGGPRRIALSLVACTHGGQINLPIPGWPIVLSFTASITPTDW